MDKRKKALWWIITSLVGSLGLGGTLILIAFLFFLLMLPVMAISVDIFQPMPSMAAPPMEVPEEYLDGKEYVWPTPTLRTISSGFGYRFLWGNREFHGGIDMVGEQTPYAPVYATADGVVTHAGAVRGYGQAVYIDHGNGLTSVYGHLQYNAYGVRKGDEVKKGQYIGRVGAGRVGSSTGPHLHFEIRIHGQKVDPRSFVSAPADDPFEEVDGDGTNG